MLGYKKYWFKKLNHFLYTLSSVEPKESTTSFEKELYHTHIKTVERVLEKLSIAPDQKVQIILQTFFDVEAKIFGRSYLGGEDGVMIEDEFWQLKNQWKLQSI